MVAGVFVSAAGAAELSVLFSVILRSRDLLAFFPGLDNDREVPVAPAAAGAPSQKHQQL